SDRRLAEVLGFPRQTHGLEQELRLLSRTGAAIVRAAARRSVRGGKSLRRWTHSRLGGHQLHRRARRNRALRLRQKSEGWRGPAGRVRGFAAQDLQRSAARRWGRILFFADDVFRAQESLSLGSDEENALR